MNNGSKLISIKHAAEMLGVTPLTLRNWDKNGKLKALRHPMNNYRVYKRDDVEKIVQSIESNTTAVAIPKKTKAVKKLQVRHLES